MKNANALKNITNETNAKIEELRKNSAIKFVEEEIAPRLEDTAKVGIFAKAIVVPTKFELHHVVEYLEANGFKVRISKDRKNPNLITISWN